MSKNSIIGVEKDGDAVILTDASGGRFRCHDAEELWADLMGILNDDALPVQELVSHDEQQPMRRNGPVDDTDIAGVVNNQVNNLVADRYGEMVGLGAGDVAGRLTPLFMRGLRKVSSIRRLK